MRSLNDPMGRHEHISIGEIVGAHGLKGAVKICFYGDGELLFSRGDTISIRDKKSAVKTFIIEWTSFETKNILMRFRGVTDRNASAMLIGCEIIIEKGVLPDLDDGSYYWVDIIGLSVFTSHKNYLGLVDSVIPTGSNDVYVVKDGMKEVLIPALASVVKKIDLEKKTMTVDLPEGL